MHLPISEKLELRRQERRAQRHQAATAAPPSRSFAPPPKAARQRTNIIPTEKQLGYRFIDKDPELDVVIGLILDSHRSPEWIETETIKLGCKVSRHCLIGWLYGDTKRPQNYTLTAVMTALGYRKEWVETDAARPQGALDVLRVAELRRNRGKLQRPARGAKGKPRQSPAPAHHDGAKTG